MTSDISNPNGKEKKSPLFHPFSRRFHMILLLMSGFCCTTFMRLQIAITLTCMVNSTAVAELDGLASGNGGSKVTENPFRNDSNYVDLSNKCDPVDDHGRHIVMDYGGSLVWTQRQQNIVLSGTMWGAMISCLPAMFIVQRGSPRLIFVFAMSIYILSTSLTPFLAVHYGWMAAFAARVLMGMGEGVVLPSINAIITNWYPVEEKSTTLALFTVGNQIAAAGGTPIAGALCASSLGWPAVYYMAGIMGTTWAVVWGLSSADQPADCKVITKKEREYLASKVVTRTKKQRRQPVPYSKMFTSPAFIAQLQAHFVINMVMSLLQLYLPTYFKEVLRLGVIANGSFLVLPSICQVTFKITWGLFMDRMKEKKLLSPTTCVRLSQSIANLGATLALIAIAYLIDCTKPVLALIIFCSMYSSLGAFTSGFYTSLMSIAPRYTATLSSISQFASMMGRVTTPFLVGAVKNTGTITEWRTLFLLTAAISALSGFYFAIFGSGEVQSWGRDDEETIPPPLVSSALPLKSPARSRSDLKSEESVPLTTIEEEIEILGEKLRSESILSLPA